LFEPVTGDGRWAAVVATAQPVICDSPVTPALIGGATNSLFWLSGGHHEGGRKARRSHRSRHRSRRAGEGGSLRVRCWRGAPAGSRGNRHRPRHGRDASTVQMQDGHRVSSRTIWHVLDRTWRRRRNRGTYARRLTDCETQRQQCK